MFFLRFHKQTFRVGPPDPVSTCFVERENMFCDASAYQRIVTHHFVSITTFILFTVRTVLKGWNSRPTWISQDSSNERINKGIQALGVRETLATIKKMVFK